MEEYPEERTPNGLTFEQIRELAKVACIEDIRLMLQDIRPYVLRRECTPRVAEESGLNALLDRGNELDWGRDERVDEEYRR